MGVGHFLQFEKHLFKRTTLPIYLILFVTEQCQNHCRHCLLGDYDLAPRMDELTLDEYEKISKSMGKLMILLPTGGEPFSRLDLPQIVKLFYDNNSCRHVGMPTSGDHPRRILRSVKRMLSLCPELDLGVEVSIDGYEGVHNHIRRNPQSYQNAMETLRLLQELENSERRLTVGVASVFSSYNEDTLLDFYTYLRDRFKISNYTLLLTRGNPYDPVSKKMDLEKYKSLVDVVNADLSSGRLDYNSGFFSRFINAKRIIRNNLVYETATTGKYHSPCHAGRLAGVIHANGDVYPCEMLPTPLAIFARLTMILPRYGSHHERERW